MKFSFLIFPFLALTATAKELIFETFEGDGFDSWTEDGESFGTGPSAGGPSAFAELAQGWAGTSFACSFTGGDGGKGSLTSEKFTIEQGFIHFLVGGGKHLGQTSVQLLSDGEVLVEAVGDNDHLLRPISWDVQALKGQEVQIRILDARDGSWGFIMADHFVFADTEAINFPQPLATEKTGAAELVATDVIAGLTIPAGTYAKVFATGKDHQLYSPAALCLDEQGNVLVAETHRLKNGTEDNRNHRYWLLDDNASDGTASRRAMHERFKDKVPLEHYTRLSEKVRILTDTNNDGVADSSKVFSEGYNDLLDGISGGIFSLDGTTYFACIPHIWTLRDKDGDGVAEEKKSLFEGFGTRVSLSGHDLNGFVLGPDGRIYGTMGDRSMRVTSKEGKEFFLQDQGAIFRFDPDGSNFETIHTGLRNPKEIAFDKWGNAVTVDNNSDQGDQARLVYIIEGADSGWRVGHQNLHTFHKEIGYEKRPINQWMQEKQWELQNDLQPAFILPPLHNFTNGPCGLTYQPGTGLSTGCEDSFLVCDYKGGGASSGIWAFGVEADGAGMRVIEPRKWNWGTGVTDVEFGYDGKVYVADFIKGWQSHEDGRVYTISSEANDKDPAAAEVATLISEGFHHRDPAKLLELLGHADQRIRLRATLALSHKPEGLHLFRLATEQRDQRLKRLHGVWGLSMLSRREQSLEATELLLGFLTDDDSEIRSQAAKALGEAPLDDPGLLANSLRDPSARVRAFAAISLGRQKATDHFNDLIVLLAENSNRDLHLRHAGIMGLVGCATPQKLAALKDNPSSEVRISAVVALRRLKHPDVVAFLFDQDPRICDEVIRAVHDVPIEAARPVIAALLPDYLPGKNGRPLSRMQLRRIVHSSFRVGNIESISNLLQFAANPEVDINERLEALRLLSVWENPPSLDQSLGRHLPFPQRLNISGLSNYRTTFETHLTPLLDLDGPILAAAIGLAGQYGMAVEKLNDEALAQMVAITTQESSTRIRALELLAQRQSASLDNLLPKLIKDPDDAIAIRTLSLLIERNPAEAITPIRKVIGSGNDRRKQHAWSQLATLPVPEAVTELTRGLASLQGSTRYPSYALELVAAADARPEPDVKRALAAFRASLPAEDPLGEFRLALRGGDPEQGAALFQTHAAAQCMRCHQVSAGHSAGGEAGPNLADIGERHDAEYILHSLIDPNAAIAPGYGVISVTFNNDTGIGGILMEETESTLVIKSGTDLLRVNKSDLKDQTTPISAMLPTGELLTKPEMRDLVSYLVKQKDTPVAAESDTREAVLLDPDSLLPDEPEPEPEIADGPYKLDPAVMKEGRTLYTVCSGCHGPNAKGMPGLAPPLAMSDWVNGPPENLIRIQLRGLIGAIKVSGQEFNYGVPMPPQATQTDEQIAAVLTYVRNSFGNASPPVTPNLVASFRDEVGKPMLTAEDLIPPPNYPPQAERPGPTPVPPPSILDDEDLDDGWPWWAYALIVFWGTVCIIPLVKQFKKGDEDE